MIDEERFIGLAENMKKKQEQAIAAIEVDGEQYKWSMRHSWIATGGEALKGICVSVWHEPGRTRELIIDFPFSVFGLDQKPKPADLIAAVKSAIQSAIAEGWRPESRGRPFRYAVPERL